MKKGILIVILIVFALASMVSADWSANGHDYQNTNAVSYSFFNMSNATTIPVVCGTSSPEYWNPMLSTTIDGNVVMFIECGADGGSATSRIVAISSSYSVLDTIAVSSNISGSASTNPMPFSLVYDANGTLNIAVLDIKNGIFGAGGAIGIIEYPFNGTKFGDGSELYFNESSETSTMIGTVNMSQYAAFYTSSGSSLQCYQGSCYIVDTGWGTSSPRFILGMNATNGSLEWIYNYLYDPSSSQYGVINPVFYSDTMFIPGNSTSNPTMHRYNLSDGIDTDYPMPGLGSISDISIQDCAGSSCDNAPVLIVSDKDHGSSLFGTNAYSLTDMSHLKNVVPGSFDTDFVKGWIEDTNNDGTSELCSMGYLASGGHTETKCSSFNLFGSSTFSATTTANSNYTGTASPPVLRGDFNRDGRYDLVNGKYLYTYTGSSTMDISTPTALADIPTSNSTGLATEYIDMGTSVPGLLLSWTPGSSDDTLYFTSSQISGTNVTYTPPQFLYGPIQSIANPICSNSTATFTCTYANGCAKSSTYPNFGIYYDCFGDGTQTGYLTPDQLFLDYDSWTCNMSNTSGTQHMNLTIFQTGYESQNDTMVYNYTTSDSSCYTADNPGNVTLHPVNTPPQFVGLPTPTIPSPYCLDSTVYFNCSPGTCYQDAENDPVWFAIDCNGDGVYNTVTGVGTTSWSGFKCDFGFNTSGSHTVAFQVYDLAHVNPGDSGAISMVFSQYNQNDTVNAQSLLCSSSNFFDNGGSISLPSIATYTNASDMSGFNDAVNTFATSSTPFRFIWGIALILFVTVGIVSGAHKKGVRGSALMVIGAVAMILSVVVMTALGLIPAYVLILLLIIGAMGLAYKSFIVGNGGG